MDGEEKIKQIKNNIRDYSRDLKEQLDYLVEHEYNNLNTPEKIAYYQAVVAELENYAQIIK